MQFLLVQEELNNKNEELEKYETRVRQLEKKLETSILSEKVY